MNIEDAIATLRAAGYRVTKPKAKRTKSSRVGPTCVCTFADGTQTRMSTYCKDDKLDWDRGLALCRAAWSSRKNLPSAMAPPVLSASFERDGVVLATR